MGFCCLYTEVQFPPSMDIGCGCSVLLAAATSMKEEEEQRLRQHWQAPQSKIVGRADRALGVVGLRTAELRLKLGCSKVLVSAVRPAASIGTGKRAVTCIAF